jgi:hypothetical protein
MVEVPSWFLVMICVVMFAAAYPRRRRTAFLHETDQGPVLPYCQVGVEGMDAPGSLHDAVGSQCSDVTPSPSNGSLENSRFNSSLSRRLYDGASSASSPTRQSAKSAAVQLAR